MASTFAETFLGGFAGLMRLLGTFGGGTGAIMAERVRAFLGWWGRHLRQDLRFVVEDMVRIWAREAAG